MTSKARLLVVTTAIACALTFSTSNANAVAPTLKVESALSVSKEAQSAPSHGAAEEKKALDKAKSQEAQSSGANKSGPEWLSIVFKVVKWFLGLFGIGK